MAKKFVTLLRHAQWQRAKHRNSPVVCHSAAARYLSAPPLSKNPAKRPAGLF
ncbi:hypothetical protein J3454_10640 [Erythrobacter sp. NFXS35]|uniref:hypothetical protein n=1 Tax=Erythrobacter sp. NFXS35 TaxID=2818436 RepID=UPI0032E000C0